jgi:hypothetical protein
LVWIGSVVSENSLTKKTAEEQEEEEEARKNWIETIGFQSEDWTPNQQEKKDKFLPNFFLNKLFI